MSNSNRLFLISALVLALIIPGGPGFPASELARSQSSSPSAVQMSQELFREVSSLRGLDALRAVKVRQQSRAEIERSLIRDMDKQTKPEEVEAVTKSLELLGLIPEGFDLRTFLLQLLVEQVAGYYRPMAKTLYLADWLDLEDQRTVMVHELMHALQDQHFDLRRFEKPIVGQSDRDLAIHALIEGEATAVMLNYLLKPHRLDITRLPGQLSTLFDQMDGTPTDRDKLLESAPRVIRETLLFPYLHGTQFVKEVLAQTSWGRISEAYRQPPSSTEQILHPDRFLNRDVPREIQIPSLKSVLGDRWKRRLYDVNGEFGYYLVLAEFLDQEVAREAASGWDGDQLMLYENVSDGKLLLAQFSTWDTQADAREFARAYERRISRRYADVDEKRQGSLRGRLWKTSVGVVYLEADQSDILIIETKGSLNEATLDLIAGTIWGHRR